MNNLEKMAITDVLIRYATGIDRRDWLLFRTCFIENVDADYGDFGHWKNVDEITGFMDEVHRAVGMTLHRITNIVIDVTGDTATSRAYVDALLMPLEGDGNPNRGIGYYDDELVKRADGWKIAKRNFILVASR